MHLFIHFWWIASTATPNYYYHMTLCLPKLSLFGFIHKNLHIKSRLTEIWKNFAKFRGAGNFKGHFLSRSLYSISRMGGPGSNGRGIFDIGESKNFSFFQTRKFSKMLKINEKI